MKIDADMMEHLAEHMTPYDVVELLGMLTEEHRQWAHGFLMACPPEGIDPIESAVNAYLALRAPELPRFRKRIREMTNERPAGAL